MPSSRGVLHPVADHWVGIKVPLSTQWGQLRGHPSPRVSWAIAKAFVGSASQLNPSLRPVLLPLPDADPRNRPHQPSTSQPPSQNLSCPDRLLHQNAGSMAVSSTPRTELQHLNRCINHTHQAQKVAFDSQLMPLLKGHFCRDQSSPIWSMWVWATTQDLAKVGINQLIRRMDPIWLEWRLKKVATSPPQIQSAGHTGDHVLSPRRRWRTGIISVLCWKWPGYKEC